MKVLFFGRKGCIFTNNLLDHLQKFNWDLEIVLSGNIRHQKLPETLDNWNGDLILCFRSLYILPKSLIIKSKIAAINFHPGPPEYPGSGGINFALYENKKNFGVTVHLMNEKVDSGKILDVVYFPIVESDNVETLLKKTHEELLKISKKFISCLEKENSKFLQDKLSLSKFLWSKKKRTIKEVDDLSVIYPNISKNEILKRIRSFHTSKFPLSVYLNGYKFTYDPN